MFAWLPENVSTFGGDIDSIFRFIYYIVGFWFLATQGFLIYCLIRFRRGRGGRTPYLHGNNLAQAAWILVPLVFVLVLDLWIDFRSADVWARVKIGSPKPEVTVEVLGKQFNWIVTYPGPDGKFGTADDKKVENELHVPAGKVVQVVLKGEDVIHSFFLPHLRLKQDVVPGRAIKAWFQATKPGKWEIPCAELCGVGHSGMKGWLFVHPEAEYKAWSARLWPGTQSARAVP
ncbi:MAG: cytochrome c oxidase subunit II [Candidatus Tectomicrobia bacterium]|uniref:cytochrome-c oxidase n=1 Tax=Tectimicrobiota bacterium TaxID=2528274 RepID=A0A932MM72_UNCTE|nr:cytochrome c oxidase subunit II [Candidatus Tectomicrobia bacterium]